MILGIGIDIVEVDRIGAAIARTAFQERVYTPAEREYCDSRGAQRPASYAARFAAKEAVMKALGTGLRGGTWQDIEILLNELGRPEVRLRGYFAARAAELAVSKVHVSLSHTRDYAAAQAVAEGGTDP